MVLDAQPLVNEKVSEYLGWTAETLLAPVKPDDYGKIWPPGQMQYFKELYFYSVGGSDDHDAAFHMVNAIKLDLPHIEFVKYGYINTTFLRVVDEFCKERDLAIAGAASSGKTFPIAACVLQDWKAAPHKTLSFVCTTSLGASEDRIWGAIVSNYQRQQYECGTYVAHKHAIVWDAGQDDASEREYSASIKAIAIPPGEEGRKATSTLRGRKKGRVRMVFDELPEMGLYVPRSLVNLESNIELKVVYIGNPHRPDDAHGDVCRPDSPLGYKSVNLNTPKWKTRTGVCVFMHGEWSPNFQAGPNEPIPFPYLTNRLTLARMLKRCHGNRESIEYYRNAIGFWPDSSITETVLTIEIILQYEANLKKRWKTGTRPTRVAGLDVGFGRGGDLCVLQIGELGTSVDSRRILQHLKEIVIMPPAYGVFEEQIAKQVVDHCIANGVEPENLGMDISADGGKILREIVRYWILVNKKAVNVHAISSMDKPSHRIVSNVDTRKCDEAFDRKVTEYWMMVREGVMTRSIMGIPFVEGSENELVEELCARIYEIRNKKFCVEKKEDMKERIKKSPDRADAFAYMVEMARRLGLTFLSPEDDTRIADRREENEEREQRDREWESYSNSDWGEEEDVA